MIKPVREIVDRIPGFQVDSAGPSGRYPYMKTRRKNINIIVSRSHDQDWIGVAAIGEQAREDLYKEEDIWKNRGYERHQKTRDSHKTNVSYIKKFGKPPRGGIDPGMISSFNDLKKWLC